MKRNRRPVDLTRATVMECLPLVHSKRGQLLMSEAAVGFNHGWFRSLVDLMSKVDWTDEIELDDLARQLLSTTLTVTPYDQRRWLLGLRSRREPIYFEVLADKMGEYLRVAADQKARVVPLVAEVRNTLIGWAALVRQTAKRDS